MQKGLETWKSNNLEALLDAEIKKRFPEKDPKDIEMEKLKNEITQMRLLKEKETLTNKAIKLASEKGLPLDLVSFFIGEDEDNTTANLKKLLLVVLLCIECKLEHSQWRQMQRTYLQR